MIKVPLILVVVPIRGLVYQVLGSDGLTTGDLNRSGEVDELSLHHITVKLREKEGESEEVSGGGGKGEDGNVREAFLKVKSLSAEHVDDESLGLGDELDEECFNVGQVFLNVEREAREDAGLRGDDGGEVEWWEVDDVEVRWEVGGVDEVVLCRGGVGCDVEEGDLEAMVVDKVLRQLQVRCEDADAEAGEKCNVRFRGFRHGYVGEQLSNQSNLCGELIGEVNEWTVEEIRHW